MVVQLAAGLVHLFEPAGGSIPSASCGGVPFRFGKYNFLAGYCSLAGCNRNSGWLLGFLVPGCKFFFSFGILTGGRLASGFSFRFRSFWAS